MALSIKNPEADRLARRLADLTGESLTEAVLRAIHERLERESGRRQARLRDEVTQIQARVARLPRLDRRGDDDLVGYDVHGLPS